MKKFMKTCAIMALIMFMAGVGIAFGVRVMYGSEAFGRLWYSSEKDNDLRENIKENIKSKINEMDSGVRFDIEEKLGFDEDKPKTEGDTEQDFSADTVCSLDIEIGACKLEILDSEDDDFHVKTKNVGIYQGYVSDSTLHIKAMRKTTVDGTWNGTIQLYIPNRFAFDDIEMEVGAGQVKTDSQLLASDLEIDLGAGEIVLPYVTVDELEASIGAGSLELDGDIRRKAELECTMGNVEMNIAGKKEDFNYDIESSAASVCIGGTEYNGMTKKKDINNDALKEISIECAMGNVSISFTE